MDFFEDSLEESFQKTQSRAKEGEAWDQYDLARMYRDGRGVAQDFARAVWWYGRAAEQGLAAAQCSLGFMFKEGLGVEQNEEEAERWFRAAAAQGLARAQYGLGEMYRARGGADAEALEWHRMAANQGFAVAQCAVGDSYFDRHMYGGGDGQDHWQAARWYQLAAGQGVAKAQCRLGELYKSGFMDKGNQDFPQRRRVTERWYRLAADQGYADAQNALGDLGIIYSGYSISRAEAERWHRLAARQGHMDAQFSVGYACSNMEEAAYWYRLAAEQGKCLAREVLARCYRVGKGVPQDFSEAVRWYRLAAEQPHENAGPGVIDSYHDNRNAQEALGEMYAEGLGVGKDAAEAERWFRRTAAPHPADEDTTSSEPEWQVALANRYRDGKGVPQDFSEAVRWYRLAAERGYADAQFELGELGGSHGDFSIGRAEADRWRRRAADEGHALAQYQLGVACSYAEHTEEAAHWYRLAAEQGLGLAQESLGELFVWGDGVQQDWEQAVRWFQSASDQGSESAQRRLEEVTAWITGEEDPPLDLIDEDVVSEQEADGQAPERASISGYRRVKLEQGTGPWLSWRDEGIGASDAPSIVGENRFKSRTVLLNEKGGGVSTVQNLAMRRGLELEPVARKLFTRATGIEVHPVCLESTRYPWLRASLDGLSDDGETVVEIKCGESAYKHAEKHGRPPRYYDAQLQHILAITGLPNIHYWSYWPDKSPIHLIIPRRDEYIASLIVEEQRFWDEFVKRR